MHKLIVLIAPLSLAACGSEPPVPHAVRVEQAPDCGACSEVVSTAAEGLVFTVDDGRLALFTDFAVGGDRTAMLEVVGVDGERPEVHYSEVAGGQIALRGVVDRAVVDVRRIAEEARVEGTIALDVHDGDVRRSFSEIRVQPVDAPSWSGGGGGHGHGHGGGTVVVVVPTERTYVDVDSGGCEGDTATDSGGCEGDTSGSSSSGGCEDTSSSSGGGCEGDTSSSSSSASCEGDSGSSGGGCEGDVAARSAVPGLFRLGWPIAVAGWWNRRRRRQLDAR